MKPWRILFTGLLLTFLAFDASSEVDLVVTGQFYIKRFGYIPA